jgi:hypothetical protein
MSGLWSLEPWDCTDWNPQKIKDKVGTVCCTCSGWYLDVLTHDASCHNHVHSASSWGDYLWSEDGDRDGRAGRGQRARYADHDYPRRDGMPAGGGVIRGGAAGHASDWRTRCSVEGWCAESKRGAEAPMSRSIWFGDRAAESRRAVLLAGNLGI